MPTRIVSLCLVSMIAAGWCAVAVGDEMESNRNQLEIVYRIPSGVPQPNCGIYSFYVCARATGFSDFSLSELQQELSPITPQGVSLYQLQELAKAKNVPVRTSVLNLEQLIETDQPAILHVDQHHYIAFLGLKDSQLLLFDSRFGLISCSESSFPDQYSWEGIALVFGNQPPWWESALQWPAIGVLAAGVLLGTLAGRVLYLMI